MDLSLLERPTKPIGSGRDDGRDGGQMSFRQQYLEQVSKDPFWQRNLHRPILGSGFYKDPVWAVDSPKAHFGQWNLRTEF